MVSKGFSQRTGIDYNETLSAVIQYDSIRYLLALTVKQDLHIYQLDAVSAYLNGSLKETAYVQQLEMFNDGSHKVSLLNKSLYGLKRSGRVWDETRNS